MKTNRHQLYEARVAKFIVKNGPEFKLVSITHNDEPVKCEACGKPDIHNEYWCMSLSTGNTFRVGCECQELVLPLAEAHIPASRVRRMDLAGLVRLAAVYGLDLVYSVSPDAAELAGLAEQVITHRQKLANAKGWESRRLQGKAPAKKSEQLQLAAA